MNRRQELSKKIYEFAGIPVGELDNGYLSVESCWKIIPKKILYSEKYGYIKYLTIDQKGLHYGKEPYFEIEDYSLHEGLLEAIWWCVDNGYLKTDNDGNFLISRYRD